MNNLEELKQELKKLENKINELESKENNNYKRPRYKDYWFLCNDGDFSSFKDKKENIDNFLFDMGNYFETKEQVENYKEKLLIEQELKDIAMELNKGKEIDWKNSIQTKYYLGFNYYLDEIDKSINNRSKRQGTIYCLDNDFKDIAIERIGKERLTKYLKGELD